MSVRSPTAPRCAARVLLAAILLLWPLARAGAQTASLVTEVQGATQNSLAAYQALSDASNYRSNATALDTQAASSADCGALATAGTHAAQQFLAAAPPPNPNGIIQNSTCFLNIMAISIPTTGIGILDAILGQVLNWVQDQICQIVNHFTQDTLAKVAGGQFWTFLTGAQLPAITTSTTAAATTTSGIGTTATGTQPTPVTGVTGPAAPAPTTPLTTFLQMLAP